MQDKDSSVSPHNSSSSAGDEDIHWQYLTWDTVLPTPAWPIQDKERPSSSRSRRSRYPSKRPYEKYVEPTKWSTPRKNLTLWISCFASAITAASAGAYTAGDTQMMAYFGVSRVVVSLGVTIFTCGFAAAPMFLAPFSEINGRRPVFLITGVLFTVMQVCCGVTRSFAGMLVARFLKGCVSSTFSTMVGGVVADMYSREDRNSPMAVFAGAAIFGTGFGPLISGFIAVAATWRWIFYVQAILCGVSIVAIIFFFQETRGSVLLSRRAIALNIYYERLEALGVIGVKDDSTESGDRTAQRIRWKVENDKEELKLMDMISVSLYRPFHLLVTEPVVFFFSIWISFSWFVLYLTFGAIPLVFENLYGFTLDQAEAVFAVLCIAAIIATIVAIVGDNLIAARKPDLIGTPEGRLCSPCIQSMLLPIGLFWFAWTSYSSVHWIVPAIGIGFATIGIYSVYLAVFNYLSDCYGPYASSALAAQSFCRNLAGGAVPLFVTPMYNGLGYHGASSLLGGVGIVLTVVPFVLILKGPKIRARSKFATQLEN